MRICPRKVSLCFFSFRVLFACPKRTKRTKRGKFSSFNLFLSPRGDRESHQREGNALFDDFCRAFGHSKAREEKSYFMILHGGSKPYPVSATPTAFASRIGQFPPYDRAKVPSTVKTRNQIFHPLFLLHMQAQKKKLSKRKRRNEISRSAERDEDSASSTRKPLKRLDLNFNEKSDG